MRVSAGKSLVGAAAIALALLAVPWAAPSTGAATKPTLHQLEHDVAVSVRLKRVDAATTIPPLAALNPSDVSVSPIRASCYSQGGSTAIPPDAAVRCAYGATAAAPTILLAGDSQAGMWLPALGVVGHALGWRVVILAKEGCSPWAAATPAGEEIAPDLTAGECAQFNEHVAEWARTAKPAVVLLDGLGERRRAALQTQMAFEASQFAPSGARLLVISPAPLFAEPATSLTPSDCLDGASAYSSCELPPGDLLPTSLVGAEATEAHEGTLKILDVTPLFCTPRRCAIVVRDGTGDHLVFYDSSHVNRFFSSWVSTALAAILEPLLPSR
jgi:SGNH domain (fused to AT3 domains)